MPIYAGGLGCNIELLITPWVMYRFTWYLYQNVGEEEEYLPIMNLGGFGLLNRIISGLYGLSPYIHDFLLENTSHVSTADHMYQDRD